MVYLDVRELDRSVAFTRDVMGISLEILRWPHGSHCTVVDPDGYELELFQPAS